MPWAADVRGIPGSPEQGARGLFSWLIHSTELFNPVLCAPRMALRASGAIVQLLVLCQQRGFRMLPHKPPDESSALRPPTNRLVATPDVRALGGGV